PSAPPAFSPADDRQATARGWCHLTARRVRSRIQTLRNLLPFRVDRHPIFGPGKLADIAVVAQPGTDVGPRVLTRRVALVAVCRLKLFAYLDDLNVVKRGCGLALTVVVSGEGHRLFAVDRAASDQHFTERARMTGANSHPAARLTVLVRRLDDGLARDVDDALLNAAVDQAS